MARESDSSVDVNRLIALANETRLHIIKTIDHTELSVNEIAKEFKLSRPTISHHLQILKQCGILEARRDGKEIYYSVNFYVIQDLARALLIFSSNIGI